MKQKQRQSHREIFRLADSFRWIRQNILEKIVMLFWQVRMDQQKRGEFGMLVLILKFFIFFMFEGWKLWPLHLQIWNKLRKQHEPLMLVIFLYLRIPQFRKLNLQWGLNFPIWNASFRDYLLYITTLGNSVIRRIAEVSKFEFFCTAWWLRARPELH